MSRPFINSDTQMQTPGVENNRPSVFVRPGNTDAPAAPMPVVPPAPPDRGIGQDLAEFGQAFGQLSNTVGSILIDRSNQEMRAKAETAYNEIVASGKTSIDETLHPWVTVSHQRAKGYRQSVQDSQNYTKWVEDTYLAEGADIGSFDVDSFKQQSEAWWAQNGTAASDNVFYRHSYSEYAAKTINRTTEAASNAVDIRLRSEFKENTYGTAVEAFAAGDMEVIDDIAMNAPASGLISNKEVKKLLLDALDASQTTDLGVINHLSSYKFWSPDERIALQNLRTGTAQRLIQSVQKVSEGTAFLRGMYLQSMPLTHPEGPAYALYAAMDRNFKNAVTPEMDELQDELLKAGFDAKFTRTEVVGDNHILYLEVDGVEYPFSQQPQKALEEAFMTYLSYNVAQLLENRDASLDNILTLAQSLGLREELFDDPSLAGFIEENVYSFLASDENDIYYLDNLVRKLGPRHAFDVIPKGSEEDMLFVGLLANGGGERKLAYSVANDPLKRRLLTVAFAEFKGIMDVEDAAYAAAQVLAEVGNGLHRDGDDFRRTIDKVRKSLYSKKFPNVLRRHLENYSWAWFSNERDITKELQRMEEVAGVQIQSVHENQNGETMVTYDLAPGGLPVTKRLDAWVAEIWERENGSEYQGIQAQLAKHQEELSKVSGYKDLR